MRPPLLQPLGDQTPAFRHRFDEKRVTIKIKKFDENSRQKGNLYPEKTYLAHIPSSHKNHFTLGPDG